MDAGPPSLQPGQCFSHSRVVRTASAAVEFPIRLSHKPSQDTPSDTRFPAEQRECHSRAFAFERRLPLGKLQGKAAIITGASGGIGEATAKVFLQEGASVMLVGRSEGKLKETVARLGAKQGVAYAVAEATDEAAMAAAVAATTKTFGGVDILFANAGTEGLLKPIETYARREFEEILHTNVTGVWIAIKHCIEPMKKRGNGSIIATA